MMQHRTALVCVRPTLISDAVAAGKRFRGAVARGDFASAEHAWESGEHTVGYPYMTGSEYAAAKAAFIRAVR